MIVQIDLIGARRAPRCLAAVVGITSVEDHRAVLTNTFLREFEPVPDMPELYRACADMGFAFHYVSGSPWQLYRPLATFLEVAGLPYGSFDLKHFRLKDPSTIGMLQAHQASKLEAIDPILTAYPRRRFILIGDSGEQDPEIYAQVAAAHPEQVVAVFIRNVTGETIDDARYRTLTTGLGELQFHVFDHPEELYRSIEEIAENPQ